MKRAIVFGIAGQDGFYLRALLKGHNIACIGVSRSEGDWVTGSVTDRDFCTALIGENKPDYIFHLAANSTTRHDVVFENHDSISTGTLNILEAVYTLAPECKVFISGSGLQFVNEGKPISERDAFDPNSPYSVSRIHSAYAARYYRRLGLQVYIGYFFNHDSPLRSERHVNQKIAQTLKRIAAGTATSLELFDVTVKKEFGYAGDIVEAIWQLVNNDRIFEATIGTGQAFAITDWLDTCGAILGLDWQKFTTVQTGFKKEYQELVSDPGTIFSLGWRPGTDMKTLATMMIEN